MLPTAMTIYDCIVRTSNFYPPPPNPSHKPPSPLPSPVNRSLSSGPERTAGSYLCTNSGASSRGERTVACRSALAELVAGPPDLSPYSLTTATRFTSAAAYCRSNPSTLYCAVFQAGLLSTLPPPPLSRLLVVFAAVRWILARCNKLAQRLLNIPVAAADAEDNASVENRWCQLWDTVQPTALAVFGHVRRQHQVWFDDNNVAISNLLAKKSRIHKAYVIRPTNDIKTAFVYSRRLVQQRLHEMQDAWKARKAEGIQGYADRNKSKNFFSVIKAVYAPPTKATVPLLSADGSTLLTQKTQILQRWAEHFRRVLNRPSTISDAVRLPQVRTNVDLDLPPFLHETIRAVQQLPSGKALGSDAIPA
ncbi:hypothetical protein SprV_0200803900 [Sparganum proliferum]